MPKRVGGSSKSVLTEVNLLSAVDVVIPAATWTEIGSYTVPVGRAIALGYAHLIGQDNALGRLYGDFNAAGLIDLDGIIRIYARDPRQDVQRKLWEGTTMDLRTVANDRTKQFPLPQSEIVVYENWQIYMTMYVVAGGTLDVGLSTLSIDTTEWATV